MPKPSDPPPGRRPDAEHPEDLRARLIGLGERSLHKSYYPQLKSKLVELARFRALMQEASLAIVVVRAADLSIVDANTTACDVAGRSFEAMRGLTLDKVVTADLGESWLDLLGRLGDNGRFNTDDGCITSPTGSMVPVELLVKVQRFEEDRYALVFARDITRRRRAEESLRASERRYRDLVQSSRSVIIRLAPDGRILFINDFGREFFGYENEEIVGRSVFGTIVPDRDTSGRDLHGDLVRVLAEAGEDGAPHENENMTKDGRRVWLAWSNKAVRDADGNVREILSVGMDITQRVRMEEQLRHQALHDPLTGLANRSLCLDRLGRAMRRARDGDEQFAVLFLGLDRFKVVNDSMGHRTGDRLLVAVGRELKDCVGELDTVSRFGSDEFIVLLEGLRNPRQAIAALKRIRRCLNRPMDTGDMPVHLSVSAGVVILPDLADSPERLLQNAHIALRRAKGEGGGRIKVFSKTMREHTMGLLSLEQDLPRGLDNDEFFPVYQPLMRLGRAPGPAGAEVLLRWKHPQRGLVHPGQFIPVAEETGHIVALGLWVLRRACTDFAAWRRAHPGFADLSLSVNVSARQFSQAGLAERVRAILEDTGLPAPMLSLEITETAIMRDPRRAEDTLVQLKRLGVTVSVDDFGTGYSSMSYLQRLPVDTLKIDLSFVQNMHRSQADVEIVKAIINLAHSLDLSVVAEGVELGEHLRTLELLDCDRAQGYHFARPMPGEELVDWVLRRTGG